MFEILVVESNQQLLDLLSATLYREFQASITEADSARTALEYVGNDNFFDLIITTERMSYENTAAAILNYLTDRQIKIPVIVLGDLQGQQGHYENLPFPLKMEHLRAKIINMLHITKAQLDQIKLPEYVSVPLHYFFLMNSSRCDVYIRIEKKGEADQYVKRIKAGDPFDKDAMMKYQQSGLKVFYVEKKYRNDFMDSLIFQTVSKLDQHIEIDNDDKTVEVLADSFGLGQDMIAELGIDNNTVKVVASTMKTMVATFNKKSALGSLIRALLNNEGSLAYRHSHMIALMSYKVIPYMDWWPESQFTMNLKKMLFVSYFHDLMLSSDELVAINNKRDLVEANLAEEDKSLVLEHANKVSTLVQEYPRSPAGVDVILRQHHGMSNGIGFPSSFSSSISSMAIMFIVLEDFSLRLLNFQKERLTVMAIIDQLYKKYTQPAYRRCVDALKATIKKGV